jgi:ABC-2 type transport system ATP-binding protein
MQDYKPGRVFITQTKSMQPIVSISNLSKTYASGHHALKDVSLDIVQGEILALLGPNGAGKTTLISIICGIVSASSGSVTVDGHDIVSDYRATRAIIGLVPQELTLGAFETVWNTLCFSRGLFGKKPDPAYLEQLLKDLSLWGKKDNALMTLSGGMKRRVLIGKALSHEPMILFLDEPTAGVDVELRKDMWALVRRLRESGVTIILTTHYIEEAEAIADRVGVINNGELLLVDDKLALMHKLGKRQLIVELEEGLTNVPEALAAWALDLSADGRRLAYTYDPHNTHTGINDLLQAINQAGLSLKDLKTTQSSLEEIFVSLVKSSS